MASTYEHLRYAALKARWEQTPRPRKVIREVDYAVPQRKLPAPSYGEHALAWLCWAVDTLKARVDRGWPNG